VTRHQFLTSRLSDLQAYWLDVTCPKACVGGGVERKAGLPCRMLAKSYGHLYVSEVIPRLKCRVCGSPPSIVTAMDHAAGRCTQYPNTWEETIYP
jgi:hypothetical protein